MSEALSGGSLLLADEIRVVVASNFAGAIKEMAAHFEQQSGHKIVLIFGSTGKHYAQIRNGAPFDIFFAADARRPALLEKENIAIPASRFTYAIGKLVLWSPDRKLIDAKGNVLKNTTFRYLAIANPKLAPYGMAAQEVLERRKLWENLQGKMVRGENIGQAFQFVKTGNAELGFIAYSQIKHPDTNTLMEGSFWLVPQTLYTPIEQQAVLLKDNPVARDFLAFVKSTEALKLIGNMGYSIPPLEKTNDEEITAKEHN